MIAKNRWLWAGLCACAFVEPATAQSPVDLHLTDTFPEPFTTISGWRAFSDGRVLVTDRTERHVSVLDFDRGTVRQIGRPGSGPGEYQIPGSLLPLSEDRSLLVDFGNMRVTEIDADGRFGDTQPLLASDGTLRNPMATDAQGRVYFGPGGGVRMGGAGGSSDSTPVLRWDPSIDRTDTVAMLRTSSPIVSSDGGGIRLQTQGGGMISGILRRPFLSTDAWAATRDGHVAVARANGYRVDWYDPDGQVRTGEDIEYRPVRVTDDEKNAWADAQAATPLTVRLSASGGSGGGGGTMEMPRPDVDDVPFPDFKPPFVASGVAMAPDGLLWVPLSQSYREDRALFDVVGPDGRVAMRVRLPAGRSLIGFGSDSVFLIRTDEQDLQWLERYRLP